MGDLPGGMFFRQCPMPYTRWSPNFTSLKTHQFEIDTQLVLCSIHSIGTNTPWELLVAACKASVLTYRQVAHWLEFKPSVDRVLALGALARHLPEALGAEVLSEALTLARSLKDSSQRARALEVLAPHLPGELGAKVVSEALALVPSLQRSPERARELEVL